MTLVNPLEVVSYQIHHLITCKQPSFFPSIKMAFDLYESEQVSFRQQLYQLTVHARISQSSQPLSQAQTQTQTQTQPQASFKEGYLSIQLLPVDGQLAADGFAWSGDFQPHYIEDITTKTGNFKRFSVFVEMLVSAMKEVLGG